MTCDSGASPRATLQLLRASRAFAAMSGRDYVTPDDVAALGVSVLAHRVLPSTDAQLARRTVTDVIAQAIQSVHSRPEIDGTMSRPWRLLTTRGRFFVLIGLIVVLLAMASGQRDVMRLGLFLMAPPVIAAILVSRARLRMSCERSIEPAQVPLGSPMKGQIIIGQDGILPAGILMLEDLVPHELGTQPRFLVDRADQTWRRVVEYPLLGRVRGRFSTGPLTVRTVDPFGLVQLDRQFVATSEVMVTPRIVPLPTIRTIGGGGGTGEARPHRVGVIGQDDALVREYRQGDDVRRIHWRSTARWGI